jgi:hypothetical protein
MQRIQAVPERLIGVRIEVAVAVQGEAHRGMPSPGGDLLGIRPGRDPQRHRRVPKVVDPQPVQPSRPGRRPPDAMPEPGQPQRATLRTHEHQVVGRPRTGQLLGERLAPFYWSVLLVSVSLLGALSWIFQSYSWDLTNPRILTQAQIAATLLLAFTSTRRHVLGGRILLCSAFLAYVGAAFLA